MLPIAGLIAGGLLGGGGAIAGSLMGSKKETIEKHAAYEHYAPQTEKIYSPTYAPETQYAPVTSYAYQGATYIISSPEATSKKEQSTTQKSIPSQSGVWEQPITTSQKATRTETETEGTDFVILAVIGVIGLVAYGVVNKKK